jgi:hypothetical protein
MLPDVLATAGAGGPRVEGDCDDYDEGYGVGAVASTTSGAQVPRTPSPRSRASRRSRRRHPVLI